MGLQDRDYMRRAPAPPPPPPPRDLSGGWVVLTLIVAGVVGAGAWLYRESTGVVAPVTDAAPDVGATVPEVGADEIGPENPVLVGTVLRITDGDTIKVQLDSGPISVRLGSIDTPEKDQPWGREATAALARRLRGQEVALDVVTQDQYERLVAVVFLGDENINRWMVEQGHAWAYRAYLKDERYCVAEGAARAAQRGLWASSSDGWQAPWEWRAKKRHKGGRFTDYRDETVADCVAAMQRRGLAPDSSAVPEKNAPPAGNCRIKGNISSNGRIYHVPGSDAYAKTKIDEAKGERWFCTEGEAVAAGWRAPRG